MTKIRNEMRQREEKEKTQTWYLLEPPERALYHLLDNRVLSSDRPSVTSFMAGFGFAPSSL